MLNPMKDQYKTKQMLIKELAFLRQRNSELERSESEHKRLEDELQKAKDELEEQVEERTAELRTASLYARSLIEASIDPLVTISTEGKIMDVNQAVEEMTGVRRSRLIGSNFSDYLRNRVPPAKDTKRSFLTVRFGIIPSQSAIHQVVRPMCFTTQEFTEIRKRKCRAYSQRPAILPNAKGRRML